MRAKISSKTIQYQKFLHPTAIGAVRQIWCTFQRKNLFFFNQCQVQAQRVLSTFNDKKYVEKLVNEQETIKEIFKDASFSAISVNIGKNILMQEFAKLLGNDIISLVYSIEGQNLLHPSNKQNLIVLSPLGDLYFQRKIGNANCILQLDSIKSEIIIENTNIQQHQDHTNQNQSFTQTQLMHQEQNNSFLNINQLSPIKQTIKEDSFEHQQISKYQSQNEKFCLKFSAGQDYQFPILILDKSQQQKQIQSHQLGLVESANSYKDETMQQDILSLLNDDELD
ncbi:hypothetical protein SS50377_23200 [Spironucleus salmonicida]|uniref:Uncharacterized protein n=1 Tax=Spironucleus salmonicida TaxID=348837 RepID=V6LNQ4_9EUKA|nr:hypothetical protein SS50377_23200 [Spironucleus salmonicida]|eukprot:EST46302.1 Hypothetical protein SS50377_13688 [Spironucleus salmonicida]